MASPSWLPPDVHHPADDVGESRWNHEEYVDLKGTLDPWNVLVQVDESLYCMGEGKSY